MQDLTPDARGRLEALARRHGVGADAALTLLRALAAGGGAMAQFSHPELGGAGQWSRGGMVMVGDMFDQDLKRRVDALCTDLAALLRDLPRIVCAGSDEVGSDGGSPEGWWPAGLGAPASSGAQNEMRYAYFPAARRLAIRQDDRVTLHDTGRHRITGAAQGQGTGRSLAFSTADGPVALRDLPEVGAAAGQGGGRAVPTPDVDAPDAPPPRRAPTGADAPAVDPLAVIERLAELRQEGILTEEEFSAKKAELLARL